MTYIYRKVLITFFNFQDITISIKYFNFANIFLSDFIIKLRKNTNIHNYSIKLVDNK